MPGFLISQEEREALRLGGCSHLSRLVYYEAIRPYMDYATGVVGVRRGISYQSIAEELYVEPIRGRHDSGSPSRKAIISAIDGLIAAGLVEKIDHPTRDRALVFRCLLAATDQSAQNMRGTSGAHEGHTINGTSGAQVSNRKERKKRKSSTDEGQMRGQADLPMRGIPPVSGNRNTKECSKNTVEFGSADPDLCFDRDPAGQVFAHWQAVMEKPRAKFDAKRRRAVQARLKDGYTVAELQQAVDGCRRSEWHMGKNDRRTRYDDLELICRNASQVDRFSGIKTLDEMNHDAADAFVRGDFDTDGGDAAVLEGEFEHVNT